SRRPVAADLVSSDGAMRGRRPAARPAHERLHVVWPVVQRGRIEIGTVRPDERMDLGIEPDLPKESRIAERSEEFSRQHGFEVDRLHRAVIERDVQHVGTDDLEATNAVDGVVHLYHGVLAPWTQLPVAGTFAAGTFALGTRIPRRFPGATRRRRDPVNDRRAIL